MDPILDGYVSDYVSKHGIITKDSGEAFEYFANHCVVARDFPSLNNTSDIVVGGSDDTGIDGVAIFVNGAHVEDETTIDFFLKKTRIAVDFVFIQSKSGRSMSAAEIGTFCEGVYSFFKTTGMRENDDIKKLKELVSYIFKNAASMVRKPCVFMYYCTATNYVSDRNIDARVGSGVERLRELDLFSEVNFQILNKEKLTTRYDEIRLKIERTVSFSRHSAFPMIDGIRQAYIGLLNCKDLIKLISNSDGELQRNLFSENIRDFLGANKVNKEIEATIRGDSSRFRLPVLNNGITIVAREVANVADQFTLRDYQIVNGCQTSNVIFNNREKLSGDIFVPVKIVEVSNPDLVNEIVKSTNRQTQVTDEAFVALEDFHKELEKFFQNIKADDARKLLYERRRNQYQDGDIPSKQVITLTLLTKSFIAMFLDEPHSNQRYYGELLEANSARIYRPMHSLWAYYCCAVIYHNVDKYLRNTPPTWMRKYRYQACMLYIHTFGIPPKAESRKACDTFCQNVVEKTWDETEFKFRLKPCVELIEKLEKIEASDHQGNPPYRRREFTKKLLGETHRL